jgi:hypothetical protein
VLGRRELPGGTSSHGDEGNLAAQTVELELARTTQQIASALGACDGIEVVDHELVSEAGFSLAELRFFQRWDWDYRSHSGEPGGKIAPLP